MHLKILKNTIYNNYSLNIGRNDKYKVPKFLFIFNMPKLVGKFQIN